MTRLSPRLADASACCIIFIWAGIAIYIAIANPTVHVSDIFVFIERAQKLSLDDLSVWVDGLHPLGYPLLLRSLFALTGDYVVAGKTLSLICGTAGLAAIYGIGRCVFPASMALLALAICCLNPLYLSMAVEASTDMPAAALSLLGIFFACAFARNQNAKFLLCSGAAVGLSYLIRYTSIAVALSIFLWLLLQTKNPAYRHSALKLAGIFTGSFVLFAFPQLALSFIHRGNPFYSEQGRNVYFGMFGNMNWGLNTNASRSMTSLTSVIAEHPRLFLHHWYRNLLQVPRFDLVPYPLLFFSFVGLLLSLRHRAAYSLEFLLVLTLAVFTAGICIAFATPRLLLPSAALLALLTAYGIIAGIPKTFAIARQRGVPVRIPFITLLLAWLAWTYARPAIVQPISDFDRDRMMVSEALGKQGAPQAAAILSFSFDYYDMSKPTKDRFSISWYFTRDFQPFDSVGDIAARMRKDGQRFLLFDERAPNNVAGLKTIWPLSKADMAVYFEPIPLRSDRVSLYRLK